MDPKIRDQLLSSDNFIFKGLVIFLLSSISYGLLTFVQYSLTGIDTSVIGNISSFCLIICLIISPIYFILGFLKFYFSLEDKNENIS